MKTQTVEIASDVVKMIREMRREAYFNSHPNGIENPIEYRDEVATRKRDWLLGVAIGHRIASDNRKALRDEAFATMPNSYWVPDDGTEGDAEIVE